MAAAAPGPRLSELSLPVLREALLPRVYTDDELEVGDYIDDNAEEAEHDRVRCERIVATCTGAELARLLAVGAVGSREDFRRQGDDFGNYFDISLLEHVMPDVDKMRVVLEHDPTIDMHVSGVCRTFRVYRGFAGDDKLCAYLNCGGASVDGILLLLAHFEDNPVDPMTVRAAEDLHLRLRNTNAMHLLERLCFRPARTVAGRELIGSARRKVVAPPWPWPPMPRAVFRAKGIHFDDHCTTQCWYYPHELEIGYDAECNGRLSSVESLLADVLPGIHCDATPFQVMQAVVDAGRAQDLADCFVVEKKCGLIDLLERDHGVLVPEKLSATDAPLSAHGFVLPTHRRRLHPFDRASRFEQWRMCCFGKDMRDALGMTEGVLLTDEEFARVLAANVHDVVSLDALLDRACVDGRSGLDLRAALEEFCEQFADPENEDADRPLIFLLRLADAKRSFATLTKQASEWFFDHWYSSDNYREPAALMPYNAHFRRLLACKWNAGKSNYMGMVLGVLLTMKTDWTDVGAVVGLMDKDKNKWNKVCVCYDRPTALLLRAAPPMLKAHRTWVLGECLRQWQEMADIYNPQKTLGKRLRREYDADFNA